MANSSSSSGRKSTANLTLRKVEPEVLLHPAAARQPGDAESDVVPYLALVGDDGRTQVTVARCVGVVVGVRRVVVVGIDVPAEDRQGAGAGVGHRHTPVVDRVVGPWTRPTPSGAGGIGVR